MAITTEPVADTTLPKQFLVTRERRSPEPGWQRWRLGEFYVYCSPGVGVTPVVQSGDSDGPVAFVLGWFSYRETFYSGRQPRPLQINGPIEAIYPEMAGRFVVLSRRDNRLICTADAGAQFPVVYRPETGELGSTPLVLGWSEALVRTASVDDQFSRADGTLWYPFGATPYAGVERLLPQQRVALGSGGATLIDWQRPSVVPLGTAGLHKLARDFIGSLSREEAGLECHLTAGWDSRMVVSASLPWKNGITYLTYLADGATARVDADVAADIARRFELDHVTVPVSSPSRTDAEQWLARTSGCVNDSVVQLTRTVVETYQHRFGLSGVGGEVGRAFYWNRQDIGRRDLTPEQLLQRLGFAKTRSALSRADQWLDRYRDHTRTRILDRAYIDIRLGCWAGPALCGHRVEKPTLSPFNSLLMYESMLALPERYRLSGEFARDFIAEGSTALSRIPVNRPAGMRRLQGLPREMARILPKNAKVHIRRLLASALPV